MDKIKRGYIFLTIALVLLIGITGTFAWYVFRSRDNAIVNTNVCAPEIEFIGGNTINGSNLKPVATKEEGLSKSLEVSLNNTCTNNDTVNLNLKLKLTTFPSALATSSFVWELYKSGTSTAIATGNFAGRQENDIISLATNEVVTSTPSTYTLYIYINGNVDNPSTMGGQNINFKLYGEGVSAINVKYYMARKRNSAETSPFWGTSINANQVRSISFVKKNDVPADIPSENISDISLTPNSGDVILSYKENGTATDGTVLYDVYVATNNGLVYCESFAYGIFAFLSNCISIDLRGFDTSNVTNMSRMFRGCKKITSLDLSSFDTSNVTDMASMFNGCYSITSLDLSSFDISKVTKISEMFRDCYVLTSINGLDKFTLSPSLTSISYMFYGCEIIEELDLSSFDTSNITNMTKLFFNCKKLTTIYVSNSWTINSVTSGDQAFDRCYLLVGQNNTAYNSSNISYTYAVIDTPDNPGYLTLKE